MASVVVRRMPFLSSRLAVMTTVRYKDTMMADPLEHATGLEKREMLARLAGNDDPFQRNVFEKGPSTKAHPTEVPSVLDSRIIGCICEEDQTYINWMWLHKGENKRCECGYWFKLVDGKAI